jgi:hypothetical protein
MPEPLSPAPTMVGETPGSADFEHLEHHGARLAPA